MPYDFQAASVAFKDNHLAQLANDPDGFRFHLLRTLSRKEYLAVLANLCGIESKGVLVSQLLETLYLSPHLSVESIIDAIQSIHQRERAVRLVNEPKLLSELYRLQTFDWGGLHQNSLEKTIVDRYVKKIETYDELCKRIDTNLYTSLHSYVLCSWYNHWTSIVIEDIFKDHKDVLPAVGLIKNIDFFIHGIPFDLKVTYFPEGYIQKRRKEADLQPELTLLKQFCRKQDIVYPSALPSARLLEDLWYKVLDHPSNEASNLVNEICTFREELLDESYVKPKTLIEWLYENQGVRRFDASNRIYLVLVNKSNYFESWKLKRARDFLFDKIHDYLDEFSCTANDELSFTWDQQTFHTKSKAIFVIK